MRILATLLGAGLGLWIAAAPVAAQSFNCDLVTAPDERAICADADLSRLDEALAQVYRDLLASLRRRRLQGEVANLQADQRVWILDRRSCASNRVCLRDFYNDRIRLLRNALRTGSTDGIGGG